MNVSVLFSPPTPAELARLRTWLESGESRHGPVAKDQLEASLLELTHARGTRGVALVHVDSELVAVATWRRRQDRAELDGLVVAPERRGEGIGGAALDAVLGHLRARRAARLAVAVDAGSVDEVWFYLANGFTPVGATWRRLWPCQLRCLAVELERVP